MKKVIVSLSIIVSVVFSFWAQSTPSVENNEIRWKQIPDSAIIVFPVDHFINPHQAKKIMGSAAYVKDSTYKNINGYQRFFFTYNSKTIDKKTKVRQTLFFSFEKNPSIEDAKTIYDNIKSENEKTLKVTDLPGLGEEAFLAKDESDFPFIMVRKNNTFFKFKLRNQTNPSSLNKLKKLASKVVAEN